MTTARVVTTIYGCIGLRRRCIVVTTLAVVMRGGGIFCKTMNLTQQSPCSPSPFRGVIYYVRRVRTKYACEQHSASNLFKTGDSNQYNSQSLGKSATVYTRGVSYGHYSGGMTEGEEASAYRPFVHYLDSIQIHTPHGTIQERYHDQKLQQSATRWLAPILS